MRISPFRKGVVLMATCIVFGGVVSASNFSFTGSFSTDDQLQTLLFNLSATATVTTVTYSYAGGTNQAGMMIPEGGFDPWLAIFDSTGSLVASVDDGTCGQVPMDSMTGACLDSFISQPLGAGAYTLILSQSDNQPVGTTLAQGYTRTGQTNFTGPAFGCSDGMFCDLTGANRTPNWAVDIDNVGSASAVPEPGTVLLGAAGLTALMLARRRKRTSAI